MAYYDNTYYTTNSPPSNATLKQTNNYFVSIGGTQIKIGTQKIYSWTESFVYHRPTLPGLSISSPYEEGETVTNEYVTEPKYSNNIYPYKTTEEIQYKKNLDGSIRLWRFGPNSRFYYNGNEQQNPWRTPGNFKDFG